MFERFTDQARRALVLAQEEVRLLEHDHIGTEHLLLGLLRLGDGVATNALGSLRVEMEAARSQVRTMDAPAARPFTGSFPFDRAAKRALEQGLREALQLGHRYIGTEHLLLALVADVDGAAARVLGALGTDAAQVRGRVVEMLGGSVPPDARSVGPTRGPGPRCPACGFTLGGGLGCQVIPARGQGTPGLIIDVVVAFCLACGVVIPAAPLGRPAVADPATAAPASVRSIMRRTTAGGARWVLTAGGGEDAYSTMLRIEDGSGTVDSGGMGGPKLWGSNLLNVYTSGDGAGAVRAIVVRCHPSIEYLAVARVEGAEIEMVTTDDIDGLRFGVVVLDEAEPLREVIGADRDGEILERFDLRGQDRARPSDGDPGPGDG